MVETTRDANQLSIGNLNHSMGYRKAGKLTSRMRFTS